MSKNKLYVVGIGAGDYDGMTVGAVKALEETEVIAGYTGYTQLVKPWFPEKEYIETPMTKETERCRLALECAASGRVTAMICSGDAGIYGMASPILELASGYDVEVKVLPGVTAASSGAAVLGAPLTHDFAVVSLSDLLTPYDLIERRIEAAAQADLCLVIYNPSSRKRADYLSKACEILLRHKSADTVCGAVRNIGREGEAFAIMTLAELKEYHADMFTAVFVGNAATREIGGKMVTPRGYDYER